MALTYTAVFATMTAWQLMELASWKAVLAHGVAGGFSVVLHLLAGQFVDLLKMGSV